MSVLLGFQPFLSFARLGGALAAPLVGAGIFTRRTVGAARSKVRAAAQSRM